MYNKRRMLYLVFARLIFLQNFGDTPFFSKWFIYSFCHFDQALARGEISLFGVSYFLLRDFSTALEMTR